MKQKNNSIIKEFKWISFDGGHKLRVTKAFIDQSHYDKYTKRMHGFGYREEK